MAASSFREEVAHVTEGWPELSWGQQKGKGSKFAWILGARMVCPLKGRQRGLVHALSSAEGPKSQHRGRWLLLRHDAAGPWGKQLQKAVGPRLHSDGLGLPELQTSCY